LPNKKFIRMHSSTHFLLFSPTVSMIQLPVCPQKILPGLKFHRLYRFKKLFLVLVKYKGLFLISCGTGAFCIAAYASTIKLPRRQ